MGGEDGSVERGVGHLQWIRTGQFAVQIELEDRVQLRASAGGSNAAERRARWYR